MITFRHVDESNRAELETLAVAPKQSDFVSSVTDSLQEALDEPGARAIQWGIYDGDTPVGFVMISDEVEGDDYHAHYLWKLLIDERYQRNGYGTAALDFVSGYFRERGVGSMLVSAGQGEGSPIPFYERYGFVSTGEVVFDGELLLRLESS